MATLAELQELRAAWYAAELAVAQGQEYTIGSRRLTRADAALIVRMREKYDAQLAALDADRSTGPRAFRAMPVDV